MNKSLRVVLLIHALLISFTVIPAAVMPVVAAPTGPIINGSFETGDYTGWTLWEDSGYPDFGTWGLASNGDTITPFDATWDFCDGVWVVQTSDGLPITYYATDGTYLAYQLQNGAERHRMYQDVTLPLGVITLTWDMQYTNHEVVFDEYQFLAVHIRDLSDAILETLFITTQGVDPLSIPMTSFAADISSYAGTTVRLDIELNVQWWYFDAAFDDFTISIEALEVEIDVKPGSFPNSLNLASKGVVPVAVLTTPDFDATTVDPPTTVFAGATPLRWALEDVDGDGDMDLVFFYKTLELDLTESCTEATLTGALLDGTPVLGTDSVNIVPKGKP